MENRVQAYPNLDVSGPLSSTDNAVARWNGTSGKSLQDSLASIDDSGNLVLVGDLTVDTINSGVNLSITSGLLLSGSLDVGGDITVAGLVDGVDVAALAAPRILYPDYQDQSALSPIISGTAYFIFLRTIAADITPAFVNFVQTGGGTGAQTAEVGLFSTPSAPNGGNQTLTKLVANGTLDALTGTGEMSNTVAMATSIPAGTHLWAGVRIAMATTQPTVRSVLGQGARRIVLTTVGASALTGAGPWAGVHPAYSTGSVGLHLYATLDA